MPRPERTALPRSGGYVRRAPTSEERGGPSGGHSALFDDLVHRHRFVAERDRALVAASASLLLVAAAGQRCPALATPAVATQSRQRAGSPATTSSQLSTSAAPSRISACAPRLAGDVTRARHRHHFSAELRGQPRGDQRPAPLGRLHHDHAPAASPAITRFRSGKWCGRGGVPGANCESTGALFFDARRQRTILRRVDHVGAGAEHGDGPPARAERAAMGRGVDSSREPAHHRDPARRELARQAPRQRLQPYVVARREPTTATASASSLVSPPRTYSVSGISGGRGVAPGTRHPVARGVAPRESPRPVSLRIHRLCSSRAGRHVGRAGRFSIPDRGTRQNRGPRILCQCASPRLGSRSPHPDAPASPPVELARPSTPPVAGSFGPRLARRVTPSPAPN